LPQDDDLCKPTV
jgi:hypothetical protein